MTFDDLINKLTDHLSHRPSEIVERFRFDKREQTVGETVAVYIAELPRLAIHCDKTLKDRFVCGLKQEHIQKKLLVEPNLTFAMETGSRDTVELQGKRKHFKITYGTEPQNSLGSIGNLTLPTKFDRNRTT